MLPNSKENSALAKRKRILAAVAEDIITSDNEDGGIDICNIIENQADQRGQTATSLALDSLGGTIRNTLLEINELREQNRERRHRELLQVLTKMINQDNATKNECTKKSIKNLSTEVAGNNQHNSKIEYSVEQHYQKDGDDLDCSGGSATPAKCSKLLPKCQTNNKQQVSKIKSVIALKHNDSKTELEEMRAKMLELQRQKMEDRERKKLVCLQMQTI